MGWGHNTRTSSDSSSETNTPVREQKPLPKEKHLEGKNYGTSNGGKIKNPPAGLRDKNQGMFSKLTKRSKGNWAKCGGSISEDWNIHDQKN